MKNILLVALPMILLVGSAAAQKKKRVIFPPPVLSDEYPTAINFCEVIKHKNELIYTRLIYTKIKGEWVARSETNDCPAFNVKLYLPPKAILDKQFSKIFQNAFKQHQTKSLIIDGLGVLYEAKPTDFEYPKTDEYLFVLKYVSDVQIDYQKQSL